MFWFDDIVKLWYLSVVHMELAGLFKNQHQVSNRPSFNNFKHMAIQEDFKSCICNVITGAKFHN